MKPGKQVKFKIKPLVFAIIVANEQLFGAPKYGWTRWKY